MMEVQYRRPDGSFVARVNGLPYHVTPDDPLFAEAQADGANAPIEPVIEPAPVDPKLVGVKFEGVMCSATAADQAGIAAVLLAIQLQGAAFKPTRFEFDNGTTLVITLQNWQAFASVWLPFRQSFFAVEV